MMYGNIRRGIFISRPNRFIAQVEIDGKAQVIFVIQMRGVRHFIPNIKTHPAFGEALTDAESAGVKVAALDCEVTENSMNIAGFVPVGI